jgi:D-threo-aldose 1-dehydrogenase
MIDVLQIHPNDNVCVAVRALPAGWQIQCAGATFVLPEAVPLGAKIALAHMKAGDKIFKFGEPIGSLTSDVEPGRHVHTHNLESDYLHTYRRGELVSGGRWSDP